jgi:hypothetical protein
MPSNEVRSFTPPPAYAVADTMMHTQFIFTRRLMGANSSATAVDLEKELKEKSRGKCNMGVLNFLLDLHLNYPDLFEVGMVLHRTEEPETIINSPWLDHTYFVIKDNQGVWYAGSPANHQEYNLRNPMTTVLQAQTLEGIIGAIQKEDRGHWPRADKIAFFMNKHYFNPEIIERKGKKIFRVFGVAAVGPFLEHIIREKKITTQDIK